MAKGRSQLERPGDALTPTLFQRAREPTFQRDRELAFHLIALGQRESADAIYADLQERNWYTSWVLAKRGENLAHLGRVTDGIASIERAAELAPDNWNIWYTLGLAYWQYTRDVSKSAQAFERVVAIAPSYPWGHLLLGQAYEASGRIAEAAEHYRMASQLDPSNQVARDAWRRLAPARAEAP